MENALRHVRRRRNRFSNTSNSIFLRVGLTTMKDRATDKNHGWLLFRVAVLMIAVFQARSWPRSIGGNFSKPNWVTCFILIGFAAFGILFVAFTQRLNPWSSDKWRRPSWFSSPFAFGQPLLIFDLAAYYFLVLGTASFVLEMISIPRTWAWGLPLSVGIGAWLGVRLCISVFKDKFENWG